MNYTYLFGPVQSRRLGVSLGIDLVQSKTCTLNCVYCECGSTTRLTLERREYADPAAIKAELADYLSRAPALDYVTFGGSGEPTLNTGIGEIVEFIKKSFPRYKCALLTNGTLLSLPEVRDELKGFDIILPSLDAVSDAVFAKINRPSADLDNGKIIGGLSDFRRSYKGILWLEIFIVPGINDTPRELSLLKDAALKIGPDRVQLNTLDRPGACNWVTAALPARLKEISSLFAPLPVEVISRHANQLALLQAGHEKEPTILSLIARRPSTIEEIATYSGLTINEATALLVSLQASGSISPIKLGNRTFYKNC